jgi:hypothetical protein
MTVREFVYSLCGEAFSLLEGDLVLPVPRLCDGCISRHWEASEQEKELEPAVQDALSSLRTAWGDLPALLAARQHDQQAGR